MRAGISEKRARSIKYQLTTSPSRKRAQRIAMIGGTPAFVACEAIGLDAALWPSAWLRLFSDDPMMIATGSAYLRFVGPAYGFLGLGLALYFASQGAGRLMWRCSADSRA
jgi:Na+-driven multidrug efflux pump